MARLIYSGESEKLHKMMKHLEKEHPSTKGHMRIEEDVKKNTFLDNLKVTLKDMGTKTKPALDKMDQDLKKALGNYY